MSSEDFLKEKAESAAEKLSTGVDVESDGKETVKIDKRNEFDEKLEKDIETDEAVWSSEEVEYLANNRHKMSNEELKEFMNRNSEFHEGEFERFSRSEKEYVMRHFPAKNVEDIAEQIDRTEEEVEKKIEMLGLANKLE